MSKRWHDQEIEQLLKQMPHVQDMRSKEDVFAKLKEAGAFDEEPEQHIIKQNVNKKKKSYAPYYISVAAVAVLAIIPTFLLNNESQNEQAKLDDMDMEMGISSLDTAETELSDEMTRTLTAFTVQDRFAVYGEELATMYALPAIRTNVDDVSIPTTILIPKESIDSELSNIELVEVYTEKIESLHMAYKEPPSNAQYVLYEEEGIRHYAVANKSFHNITEALQQLPNVEAPFLSPVPAGVSYTIEEIGELVTVTFNEPFDFDALAVIDSMYFIEALNLTANSFNKKIQLQNVVQTEWQGFKLKEPLPVIVGANRIYLE